MVNGRYLYSILEGKEKHNFGAIGLFDKEVYAISYKDISAVISSMPFTEMRPDIQHITCHQRVVEESRNCGTTLPVRFGILFKTEEGVKKMLTKSYHDFKTKMAKVQGKEEYGLKIILDQSKINKLKAETQDTPEIKKIKKEITASGKGSAYFLKMKMDEAIKNEAYRKIDRMSDEIHQELGKIAKDRCLLKADLEQIVLNAAYLIDKSDRDMFYEKLEDIKLRYNNSGLVFHLSGPWAPYSFC